MGRLRGFGPNILYESNESTKSIYHGEEKRTNPLDLHHEPGWDPDTMRFQTQQFPMEPVDELQHFDLPTPALCINGYLKIDLMGKVTRQQADMKYYTKFELEAINQERDFTQCRDRDSTVTLSSHIEASITSYVNDLSEIILDNLDGESAVRWDWVWQKCEDDPSGAFDGYFTASRSTSSGNLEPASITIQGSRGEFFTRNGSGILRAIQYSAGGLVAEGLWEIGLDNGAFQFELDPSRGVFKGTYVNFSSGFRGEWKGYR
jgi:hypothetical protein